MIPYPEIDPVAFSVLGWPIHWYGLMYLAAFVAAAVLAPPLLRRPAFAQMPNLRADDMLALGVAGVIIGGRIGYVLFYNPAFYFDSPSHVFRIWDGGMSFHGGLLGVIVALIIFSRKNKLPFWRVADFAAVLTPIGLGLGRVGNFINGELPGRVAAEYVPWSMVFPHIDRFGRHPSSLYQAILEGVVLASIMWWLTRQHRRPGALAAAFLFAYAGCRLFSEFFREPDAHLGLFFGVSMGQILSLPMVIAASFILWHKEIKQWFGTLVESSPEIREEIKTTPPVQKDEKPIVDLDSTSTASTSESQEEEVEVDDEDEYEDEDDSPKPKRESWWKKMFPDTVEEVPINKRQLLTRREKRRLKKKKRK